LKTRSAQRRRGSTEVARAVLRALRVTAVAIALLDPVAARAQTTQRESLVTAIPAQPLKSALLEFSHQTGLQLIYVASLVGDKRSLGATAGSNARDALTQLLRDTGLTFKYPTPGSVTLVEETLPQTRPSQALAVEEVIVTATRRVENVQDVPISMQVFSGSALASLHVTTFDDLVLHAPGVTSQGVGPAQNNIYMRGLSTPGVLGNPTANAGVSYSNVAVYLDEQSLQLPSRNPDIYAADLARVEILKGPQGTLFGAGAQAGVIRYVTNAPKLDVLEGRLDAGVAGTANGAPSYNFSVVLNLPLVERKLSLRTVVYDEKRGGYIDNIPATFARSNSDVSIRYANSAGLVPSDSTVINNFHVTGDNINPVTYKGLRAGLLYQFDEDWSALITQSYQSIEAYGVFTEMASNSLGVPLPDLSVGLFNPSYNKDRFTNTALTLEGKLAHLRVLYAGAYSSRNIDDRQDYTSYAHGGAYIDYYQCVNPGPTTTTARCFTPSSTWRDQERNTHQSHELRVRTPDEARVRGIGGLYLENYRIREQTDFFYLTAVPYFRPLGPPTGYYTLHGSQFLPNGQPVPWGEPGAIFVPSPVTLNNPDVRPPNDGFFNDITRGYVQRAAYASLDFDLIPKALTLTAGTRYYHFDTSAVGAAVGGFGCQLITYPTAPYPCINHSNIKNLNAANLQRVFSGFTSRVSLTGKIADNAMLYYTWSQGFRAGDVNRLPTLSGSPLTPGTASFQAQAVKHGGWAPPEDVAPDTLTNNELGWKTDWKDRRVQWNGALYRENWAHVQTSFYDSGLSSPVSYFANGGDYLARGVETELIARALRGVTIDAAIAWNRTQLLRQATFLWADGTPIDFNSLRTASGRRLQNPTGQPGSPLAGAPSFQGNLNLRYDWMLRGYGAFVQTSVIHQSSSLSATDTFSHDAQGNSVAYEVPAFTLYNASAGIDRGGWLAEVYGENLADTRAQLFANYAQWYKAVTTNRPRTIGLRVSYKYHQ
jgi:iron complex outermembrane recepter protein